MIGIKESTVSDYKEWSSVARNDIVLHSIEFFVIYDDFKSNRKISNLIEIKSHVFQIEITVLQIRILLSNFFRQSIIEWVLNGY